MELIFTSAEAKRDALAERIFCEQCYKNIYERRLI